MSRLAFTYEQLVELRALGLTPPQIHALERQLPVLAELLLPPTPVADRRQILESLRRSLDEAERILGRMEETPAPAEGLGRFPHESAWRDLDRAAVELGLDSSDFIQKLAVYRTATERALAGLPRRAERHPQRIAAAWVGEVLGQVPHEAAEGKKRPREVKFATDPSSPYARITAVCYMAATGGKRTPWRDLRAARKDPPFIHSCKADT